MSQSSDPLADPVRFIDERTASAPLLRKGLRYLFPDHWSFLLGEVALYSFVILIGTGIYLALFFDPSTAHTVYHGPYTPLDGRTVSDAYKSVLDISFSVKAGLLIRQTHHWAADIFMASIVIHLMRVFFTGAFRKPARADLADRADHPVHRAARGLPRLLPGRRSPVRDRPGDRLRGRIVTADHRWADDAGHLRRALPR